MEKKGILIIVMALFLSFTLWGGAKWVGQRDAQLVQESTSKSLWAGTAPEFKGEPVQELYAIYSQERSVYQVTSGEQARAIVEALSGLVSTSAPQPDTRLGFLLTIGGTRQSFYIKEAENPAEAEALFARLEQEKPTMQAHVDIYELILPEQIERVRFVGTNKNIDGSADSRRSLSLDTKNQETIKALMEALRAFPVEKMTLLEKGQRPDLTEESNLDGYYLIFDLGQSYDYQQIKVAGSRYSFTADLDFQTLQRAYSNSYEAIKMLLDKIEGFSETQIGEKGAQVDPTLAYLLEMEQPARKEYKVRGQEDASVEEELPEEGSALPSLPIEDRVPLPDGLKSKAN